MFWTVWFSEFFLWNGQIYRVNPSTLYIHAEKRLQTKDSQHPFSSCSNTRSHRISQWVLVSERHEAWCPASIWSHMWLHIQWHSEPSPWVLSLSASVMCSLSSYWPKLTLKQEIEYSHIQVFIYPHIQIHSSNASVQSTAKNWKEKIYCSHRDPHSD